MMTLPWAEEINYWQTSQSSPDTWIEKTIKLIRSLDGKVLAEAYGSEPGSGRSAFMLEFTIQGDRFKVIWPVLPSRTRKDRAAKVQAATLLFHDVKARCLSATVLGARSAFFSFLMLPDGRTAAEASANELMRGIPELFRLSDPPQLTGGDDIIEGEIV